jgi:ABC-type oligopeptide transport system ATPase subunit
LVNDPEVLILDEPVSALDVSVKAQIINLLQDLQEEMGLSILFISHDLSVVRSLTDSVTVMYRGRMVEQAPTKDIFASPAHPYTRSLLDAIPVNNPKLRKERVFLSPEQIAQDVRSISAGKLKSAVSPGDKPQFVPIAKDHFVEAIVTA